MGWSGEVRQEETFARPTDHDAQTAHQAVQKQGFQRRRIRYNFTKLFHVLSSNAKKCWKF